MSEHSDLELNEYRPVSALAIVGFVFGLLSILSMLHIVFVAASLAGILVCIMALFSMRRSDKTFIGGKLAWVGIFLCCLFGVGAISMQVFENEYRWRTAQAHADEWIRMIQEGELETAHHLTLPNHDRQGPDVDLKVYYAPENRAPDVSLKGVRQPQTGYESYWAILEPQKTMVADKAKCKIEFVRRKEYEKKSDADLYTLVYRLTPSDPNLKFKKDVGETRATIYFPLEFEIRLHRAKPDSEAGIQWHIHQVRVEGVRQTNSEYTVE